MRRLLGVLGAILLLVTQGCSTGPSLEGTWTAVSASPQTLVNGADVTLTFTSGRMSGTTGCNSFSGGYDVSGGRLKAPQLARTLMWCDGARGEQETWVMQLLSSSPTVTIDANRLTVAGAGSVVSFVRS